MKKMFYAAAAAVLLMASPAAQASGFTFHIEGQKIRIAVPRNCMSLSCLSITDNGSSINMKSMNVKGRKASDDVEVASNAPQAAPSASPVPAVQAQAAPAPAANTAPLAAPPAAANNAPAVDVSRERVAGTPSTSPARATSTASAAPTPPAPAANTAPPAPPAPAVHQEAAAAPATPFGLWQTEQGNVRVEPCGANLCGYGEKDGKKSSELVLVNMKPSSDHSLWSGRIHNPNTGKNYDATVAMRGPNLLKLQGCVLGGMICGGTTWKRIG